jgi:hypothetical protein
VITGDGSAVPRMPVGRGELMHHPDTDVDELVAALLSWLIAA